ncbi:acyl carrier protein [Streptomyces buecherae]|uniref:acyl carrier protein n=1 Tax=Streptomyces buecherae TaxID=2763006 RepID=UPI00379E0A3A
MADTNNTSTVELRQWLTERVAFYLNQSTESIDPDVELAEYGMDSIYALSVVSDVEDRLLMELDAEAVRQHRTINALVDYLRQLITDSPEQPKTAEFS